MGVGAKYFEAPERKKSPLLNESQRKLSSHSGPTLDGERKRSNFEMITPIGELIERYEQHAVQRHRTIRGNVRSLHLIVRTVHTGDPDQKPTTNLTAGLIREFEKRRLQRAEERATAATHAGLVQSTRNSTASFVRQARSIVALRKMRFYEDLKLPDLAAFRGESVDTPHRSLPRPLDMKALGAMEGATAKLAVKDPAVYVAHLLFSRLGLRNIEIVNARTHWISDGSIGIINRPEENFFPKGCEGWVPIARDVLAEIMKFQALTTNNYLVPGKNQTERHDNARSIRRRSLTAVKSGANLFEADPLLLCSCTKADLG